MTGNDSSYLTKSAQVQANLDLFGAKYTGEAYDSTRNNMEQALRWVPIGKTAQGGDNGSFGGVFDGAGHHVSNLYVNESTVGAGFLHRLTGGTIKDFGVASGKVVCSENSVGGVVGTVYLRGTVLRCWNKAPVKGVHWVGGIIGGLSSGRDIITVEGCYNSGDVTGNMWIAGIAGGAGDVKAVSYTHLDVYKRQVFNAEDIGTAGRGGGSRSQGQPLGCGPGRWREDRY